MCAFRGAHPAGVLRTSKSAPGGKKTSEDASSADCVGNNVNQLL